MPNTAIGSTGSISLPGTSAGTIINVRKWTATFNRDNYDTTPFTPSVNMETNIGGLYDCVGTFEGFLDGTTAFDDVDFEDFFKAAGSILLCYYNPTGVTNGMGYSFQGWLTEFGPTVAVNNVNMYRGAFVSTGAITAVANI